MSRIRGRGNQETEIALLTLFRKHGITGWRRQQVIRLQATKWRAGPARPTNVRTDFIFPDRRIAVFVDGCFWHGCPKHSNMPANNRTFWKKKLTANRTRDAVVNKTLRQAGWRIVRVWEHELAKCPEGCVEKIKALLESNE